LLSPHGCRPDPASQAGGASNQAAALLVRDFALAGEGKWAASGTNPILSPVRSNRYL
jgi:hypothetical protein